MPKPKKQTWLLLLPAVLVVLCAMVWLFSSQEDATGELTPADGVLDACGADFAHAVYTLGSDWTFYPETLASTQADLRGRETGAHDESVPYGTYRLELLAQPGQYLVLSGYSFDYSTRVYLNGKQVLEIGKVADTAAASEARINYMDIPIYTGSSANTPTSSTRRAAVCPGCISPPRKRPRRCNGGTTCIPWPSAAGCVCLAVTSCCWRPSSGGQSMAFWP